LRDIDVGIRFLASVLAMFEDGRLKRDPELEEGFWDSLATSYKLRTDYEHHFEILNSGDVQAKLDLWREVAK
jgi:hypothetical protein